MAIAIGFAVVGMAAAVYVATRPMGPRCPACGGPTFARVCSRAIDARGFRPAICDRCNRVGQR